ncbi:NAD-dependent epimerase/dehydratase family protein [candidate division KSB3 bacterium]|uniref:NAD-dependent epimerase/dehydratase family protein n=1 Tax=candidate division KSB3 bacterium TaxID=2044937 RepID=A0A9D5K0I2_9BACT|nr:NAD-dependent epimerase/dehydratase family protein [candidate division KSB3 bacterium]MBD3327381.1 NAD-dependent epimerase/dehydratase family protein [candidate division KSB3 bacterium]
MSRGNRVEPDDPLRSNAPRYPGILADTRLTSRRKTVKVLITGATGFVGSHLCDYLIQQGNAVSGTYLYAHELDQFPDYLRSQVELFSCDLTDLAQVRGVLRAGAFERVYHLAAISSVHKSWEGQDLVIRVNLYGWLNLLEAVQEFCPQARVLMVSSGEVYGIVPEAQQPITESQPLRPINPYADSKAAQEMFSYQYIHRHHLPIVIVRPFNHTGPRQAPQFVCPDFARQIARIEQGQQAPVMAVGNLDARRDFCDVRDVVRAYHLALEQCPIGTPLNIASGSAWSIKAILETLLTLSTVPIELRQDPQRLRPSDVPLMRGDPSLISRQTGWQAEISFEETLSHVLEYWREQVVREDA